MEAISPFQNKRLMSIVVDRWYADCWDRCSWNQKSTKYL